MKRLLMFPLFLFLFFGAARADRGPVIWHEGVQLSQESQKAIIMHNAAEEVLILGTELKASEEIEILEFIPFPSEPKVSLAKGNPFEEAAKLIDKKRLLFELNNFDFGKGGGEKSTAPVEIRLSKKIGLHDVTVVKINNVDHFAKWLEGFFKSRGIRADKGKLSAVYRNAQDYTDRGINYFVFDQVKVTQYVRFVEPLIYRFAAEKIYYPLKTSNLIGGKGDVELILALPGSISEEIWQDIWRIFPRGGDTSVMISSSSKLYRHELTTIHPEASSFFGRTAKIYLQVFKYSGPYAFKDDFTYGREKLVPYAYRHTENDPFDNVRFIPSLTNDERRDMREAFCSKDKSKLDFVVYRSVLDCWSFIPNDEYEVFASLFRQGGLRGIPARNVALEKYTLRKKYKGLDLDETMMKDFNDKNKAAYPIENAFPEDGKGQIRIGGDGEVGATLGKGRTSLSRAGFNKDRTRALLYVEHIESRPRSLAAYFVTLQKKGAEWKITGSQLAAGY